MLIASICAAATLASGLSALAQTQRNPPARDDAAPPTTSQPSVPAPAPQSLAALYERLQASGSAKESESIVRQIVRRWTRSGSDVSDVLMTRAKQALGARNGPLAIELIDRIIALQPEWAEAWHVRGLAFFVMQDDTRALIDFREALRREPGHFMALGMAAAALQRQGEEKSALAAFRKLQDMHPFFSGAKQAIERLAPKVDGLDT